MNDKKKWEKTKSGQRLDDEKKDIYIYIYLKRFGLTTFITYKITITNDA